MSKTYLTKLFPITTRLISNDLNKNIFLGLEGTRFFRNYAVRKRFYKKTGIVHSNGKYEVTLDQRKLKTPRGAIFTVESEPLALAVAAEWDAQKDNIKQSYMHLTHLCNTVQDNPNNLTKYDMVKQITTYLDTDTVLFHSEENKELYNFQIKEWDPVIDWFCSRFNVNVNKSTTMHGPVINSETKAVVNRYLLSYNFAAINGFSYAVDNLKSVILTLACVERFLTPEKTALLARLEEEFQLGRWGRVIWAHDLNQQDLQTKLSAAVLFIYFNSTTSTQKLKV